MGLAANRHARMRFFSKKVTRAWGWRQTEVLECDFLAKNDEDHARMQLFSKKNDEGMVLVMSQGARRRFFSKKMTFTTATSPKNKFSQYTHT